MMSSKLRGIKLTPPVRAIMFALFALGATAALAGTPKYGGIYFNEAVEVDGVAYPAGSTIYAETWPTQMVVKPIVPEGKTFFCYHRKGAVVDRIGMSFRDFAYSANRCFPDEQGRFFMTPLYDAGVVTTNLVQYAAFVKYVDPSENGSDATGDGTADAPWHTLQYAVDKVPNTTGIIIAKKGVYKEGGAGSDQGNARLLIPDSKNLLVKSEEGADVTAIEGQPDYESYPEAPEAMRGCGPNAYRCVSFGFNNGGSGSAIQGFTLRNGYSDYTTDNWASKGYSGGVLAQRSNYGISLNQVLDCVISNCSARSCAAMRDVHAFRCRISGIRNGGGQAACAGSRLASCVMGKGVGSGAELGVHNDGYSDWPQKSWNSCGGDYWLGAYEYYGSVMYGGSWSNPIGVTKDSVIYADGAAGDFRLLANSKALGGTKLPEVGTDYWNNWTLWYAALATSDVNGNRIKYVNGVPWSGAIMEALYSVTVSAENGALKVTSGGKVGDNALSVGETIVVAAAEDAVVHARGVIVNGEEILFADCSGSYSYMVTGDTPAVTIDPLYVGTQHVQVPAETGNKAVHYTVTGGYGTEGDNLVEEGATITIAPNDSGPRFAGGLIINGTNTVYFEDLPGGKWSYTVPMGGSDEPIVLTTVLSKIWYADANNGSDTNKGISPATAVKTLKKAMSLCSAGGAKGTVRALPGVYDEGVTDRDGTENPTGGTPLCRVRLVQGCTLESTDGPEKTIIKGAPAPGEDADEWGCGEGAVSCVRIQRASADSVVCLRGFTLTGGRTRRESIGGDAEFYNGSAVHSIWGNAQFARIENCIITNNFSKSQTTSSELTMIGCYFDDNKADSASIAFKSYLNGCLLKSGSAANLYGARNCTFGANATYHFDQAIYYDCENCLIMGSSGGWHGSNMTFTNCVFLSGKQAYKQVDCVITNLEAIGVDPDDNYRILSKDSVLVDATKDAHPVDPIVLSTRDALGGQRVYNGKVDIGAVEYDWRGDYAKDIAKREVVVSAADPQVVEREGKVTLDPGATLTAEWTPVGTSSRCDVKASVTGTGTLTVSVDGAEIGTVTAADLPKTFNFAGAIGATSKILFAYSQVEGDEGCAVIEKVGSQKGFLLFVR